MRHILLASIAVLMCAPAFADTPSFNFVQAGYQEMDLDVGGGFDVDGDGFVLGGAFEFTDSFFGYVKYSDIGFPASVDLTEIQAGIGYQAGISANTSVFGTLGYAEVEIDAPVFGSVDESGYAVGIGIRSNVSELIELNGAITHVDYGDGDLTEIGGSIYFNITDVFALGLNAQTDDDRTTYGINARFNFGQ